MRSRALVAVLSYFVACSSYGSSDDAPALAPERDASTPTDANAATDGATSPDSDDDTGTDAASGPSAAYRAAVLADSPLAYWRFAEKKGSPALASEVGAHFLLAGPSSPELAQPGLFADAGAAIRFGGGTGQRVVASTVPIDIPNPMAIEAWIFAGSPADSVSRMVLGRSNGTHSYFLYTYNGDLFFEILYSSNKFWVQTTFTSNAWHHVVAQGSQPSEIEIVLDGLKKAIETTTPTTAVPPREFHVGAADDADTAVGPDARITELALYDHVLAPARVTEHFIRGKAP